MKTLATKLRLAIVAALALVLLAQSGCFRIDTPHGFARLPDAGRDYRVRAVSPEGAVLGVQVRENELEGGTAEFWAESLALTLTRNEGYALVERRRVRSADGHPGIQLELARSLKGVPFVYQVSVFATGGHAGRVYLVEAAAPRPLFERYRRAIADAVGTARRL